MLSTFIIENLYLLKALLKTDLLLNFINPLLTVIFLIFKNQFS